jgi:hypothetical protein
MLPGARISLINCQRLVGRNLKVFDAFDDVLHGLFGTYSRHLGAFCKGLDLPMFLVFL